MRLYGASFRICGCGHDGPWFVVMAGFTIPPVKRFRHRRPTSRTNRFSLKGPDIRAFSESAILGVGNSLTAPKSRLFTLTLTLTVTMTVTMQSQALFSCWLRSFLDPRNCVDGHCIDNGPAPDNHSTGREWLHFIEIQFCECIRETPGVGNP